MNEVCGGGNWFCLAELPSRTCPLRRESPGGSQQAIPKGLGMAATTVYGVAQSVANFSSFSETKPRQICRVRVLPRHRSPNFFPHAAENLCRSSPATLKRTPRVVICL